MKIEATQRLLATETEGATPEELAITEKVVKLFVGAVFSKYELFKSKAGGFVAYKIWPRNDGVLITSDIGSCGSLAKLYREHYMHVSIILFKGQHVLVCTFAGQGYSLSDF